MAAESGRYLLQVELLTLRQVKATALSVTAHQWLKEAVAFIPIIALALLRSGEWTPVTSDPVLFTWSWLS